MSRLQHERLPDAVAELYEAARDPAAWLVALETLRQIFDGSTACFGLENLKTHECELAGVGSDASFQASYREHYAPSNLLWQPLAEHMPGTVFSDRTLMSKRAFLDSTFFNEWLAPQDAYASIGCKVLSEGPISGFINIQRGRNHPDFDADEIALMERLAPIMTKVAKLRRTLAKSAADAPTNAPSTPVIIVDEALHVLSLNRAAQELVAAGATLSVNPSGILVGGPPGNLLNLVRTCSAAQRLLEKSADHATRFHGASLTIDRGTGRAPLQITATPLRTWSGLATTTWTAVMLSVADPERDKARRKESLRQRFGLTGAESEFALEIVRGDGRHAAAERRGISASTARTHLSSIFAKTGTRRQAELVRLILRAGG